jgi:DNA-binding MarR family transcriptional regulator
MQKKTPQKISSDRETISGSVRSLIEIVWHFGPKSLDGTCCENLSMPEYIALDKISNTHDCPVQDIGLKLGFTKSGATRIVKRLEKKGLVKKHKFQDDARICCITITPKGQKALESAENICSSRFEKLIANVPAGSRSGIKDTLAFMAKALKT